ncbi:MAG TPA: gamma-glutamyltransferase [Tepidisphaeraceae bacterium]|jgi:gamma-glutamyltranspeptidase/glutathione hydrolase
MVAPLIQAAPGVEVRADHAIVATSHQRAVDIGVEILKRGGNAVDAAIATNAAMGVCEPMSCGMGGDLYAIVWDAKTQKLYGLNASGRSPYAATIDYFEKRGLKEIPTSGPLSWSVPGAVDGWDQLRQRFGTMSWEQLLTPAIECAEKGVEVPQTIGGFWHAAEPVLKRHPDSAKTFLVDGGQRAPRVGEAFVNPYVARSYRLIVQGGRDAYYKGPIAKEIVDFSQKNGGLFSLKDFEDTASTWVDPVSTTYRGYRVWEIPPPGQGISVLQMLNLIEPFDVKSMGPGSADWLQLFIETKRLAYADRAKYYTDPGFAKVPVNTLISKDYAAKRKSLINLHAAAPTTPPGDIALGGDTIYLCVVDKDRNCVSLIQSNYNGFGSGIVPGNVGFALQNRGTLFALDRNHANHLEPHRRPFHTIIPALVTKNDKPWFVFGVMGGDMQPQGHVQVLVNLIDFGMNVQAAGDFPRVEHIGSATPTGRPEKGVGTVQAEPGITQDVVDELERRGQHVVRVKKNGGGYQGILIDPGNNTLRGASESRRDGKAAGY